MMGLHGGVQQQWGSWVLGGELSFDGGVVRAREYVPQPAQFDDTHTTKIDSLFMATARLGYASGPWLIYAKGGFAGARVESSILDSITNGGQVGTAPNTFTNREWHNGWTVGAGVDYLIARNVSFGVEYNFIDLGNVTHTANVVNSAGASIGPASYDVDANIQTVMARLTFKFGRDEPAPLK
jgi:outer membrane immunogenic protein